jgi:hypothetical protein
MPPRHVRRNTGHCGQVAVKAICQLTDKMTGKDALMCSGGRSIGLQHYSLPLTRQKQHL